MVWGLKAEARGVLTRGCSWLSSQRIVDVEVDLAEGKVFFVQLESSASGKQDLASGKQESVAGEGEELLARLVEAVGDAGFDSEVLEVRDEGKWSQTQDVGSEKGEEDETPAAGGGGGA